MEKPRIKGKDGKEIRGFAIGSLNDYGSVKSRGSRFNYDILYRAIARNPDIADETLREAVDTRRTILREAGYTHLIGEKGIMIPLRDASDSRVNHVFFGQYTELQKRLERYWTKADEMVVDSMRLSGEEPAKEPEYRQKDIFE